MSERVINPDLGFVKEVIGAGGESLKKCFQCATCTVVCGVTPDDDPFPRKEMLKAQWGLKDELISNPDIWLCNQCSDCTAYCPRGAKPGEVLAAVRKISIEHYSKPAFLAKAVASPKYLWLLLGVPVAIFFAVITAMGNLGGVPRGDDGGIVFAHFIPVLAIDVIFMSTAFFATVVLAFGVLRYWKDMVEGGGGLKDWQMKTSGGFLRSIVAALTEVLAHKSFRNCDLTYGRYTAHMLVFYSFVGLTITTLTAIVYLYVFHWEAPYPLSDPMKIIGNVSAAALLIGVVLVIVNRARNSEKAGIGSYYDWLFISVVAAIMTTGILSEVLRLADVGTLAYPVYFIHLTFVFFLFAYAPFSKMAHMVYRTTAMVYERMSRRNR